MSTTSDRVPFVEAQFLEDVKKTSEEMEAPFDEKVVKEVINAHSDLMYESALQVRGSDKPGVALLFRLLMNTAADTVDMAIKHGWLHPDDPMVVLAKSARSYFKGAVEQPEFTLDKGCDGLLMYLGGLQPLEEVLGVPGMPEGIRAHKEQFLGMGLSQVVCLHLQYAEQLVSFFFLAQGPLSKQVADQLVAMCGAPPPSESVYQDIIGVLLDSPYYLTVVMDYSTGKIAKIELHLLFPIKLPPGMNIPEVGERLTSFFDMPSYEYEDMDILSYIFGDNSQGNIFALRAYCGGLRSLFKHWNIIGV
ncbi:4-hydroxyphenylpyruvate 3-dimethylallyltransferase [Cytospora mali]|uniref:4-hydroxyphenylpyruvate 3-dimethylallyltransferase n=1 Tax=Cytospora mali TaxID=578113 RepID=A0A194VXC4_CYTMA|nr:4-hydroxyphenylpyruvate 3-dimethylallyltransferase [Valsa mali]